MGTSISKKEYEREIDKIYNNLSVDDMLSKSKYYDRLHKKIQLNKKRRFMSIYL